MANNETARLAVQIDADNASARLAKELLEKVAKHGTATVKRAYGDLTTVLAIGISKLPGARDASLWTSRPLTWEAASCRSIETRGSPRLHCCHPSRLQPKAKVAVVA